MLIYCLIVFFVLSFSGLLFLYVNLRKQRWIEFHNLQNTITLLKMQNVRNRMSSHFFFNALSGISGETHDPDLVKKDLKSLSMLLRQSIENIEQVAVTLEEELEVVEGYISLQKWRIAPPFNVEYDIPEHVNRKVLVPAMCIQIPVENAIKHGLMPLDGEKLLRIKVSSDNDGVTICVEDNGIGINNSPGRSCGKGTGLKVLIQTIYFLNTRNNQKIDLTINELKYNQESARGTCVKILIPVNYSFEIDLL